MNKNNFEPEIVFKYGRYEVPEYWKPIKGFGGMYEVSNFGKIGSWCGKGTAELSDTMKILKQTPKSGTKKSNLRVFLTNKDGEVKTKYVHRIVAKHFVPNPNNKKFVIHLDFDSKNNRWDNLQWANKQELHEYMRKFTDTPVGNKGEDHLKSKLTSDEVKEIREKYGDCVGRPKKYGVRKTHEQIAKEYNVSGSLIYLILHGKIW